MCVISIWFGEFQNLPELPILIPHSPAGIWGLAVCSEQRRSSNVGVMLGQRHRRWPIIKPTLDERLGFMAMYFGCYEDPPCPVRSDRQTTSLTLTTGVCEACTKRRGCEHHEYSLWRHRFTDCCVEVTLSSEGLQKLGREEGDSELIAHIRDIKESVGSRQLDRWRCEDPAACYQWCNKKTNSSNYLLGKKVVTV